MPVRLARCCGRPCRSIRRSRKSFRQYLSAAINRRGVFEMEGSSGKSLSYIIGGSSGMGLAAARLLVADGGTVVLVAREQDKLAARKGELEAGGRGKVETIAADFYDAGAVKSLIAKIDGETRHINHLVNAAGYFIPKNFFEYTER